MEMEALEAGAIVLLLNVDEEGLFGEFMTSLRKGWYFCLEELEGEFAVEMELEREARLEREAGTEAEVGIELIWEG